METSPADGQHGPRVMEPRPATILFVLAACFLFVITTRLPVARPSALDFDEVGYLETIQEVRFPMHHTLFLVAARALGEAAGDSYRGFVLLDIATSALALTAVWWWLRAIVGPRTAAAATLALGCGPVFWSYGAMAGNYTAIPAVGALLLGIAYRGRFDPKTWHPYVAAAALAIGTGYRQDIGTFWLPVFALILWQHRWIAAIQAGLLFTALNLAWLVPVLHDAGGLTEYRRASSEFAYNAGYLNSVWNLGVVDAPLRYAVKGGMALVWTLGPGLLAVPIGIIRLILGRSSKVGRSLGHRPPTPALPHKGGGRQESAADRSEQFTLSGRGHVRSAGFLGVLLILNVLPALASHLLIHFGVPGYAFHYVPALMALLALGMTPRAGRDEVGAVRGLALASVLAAVFLLYPTDYTCPGFRGDFDLAFARHTRVGLRSPLPLRDPGRWRTVNSQVLPDAKVGRAEATRTISGVIGRPWEF